MHRGTVGRTRGVRGPDALELAFAGLIVTASFAIALWFGGIMLRMAQTLEPISLMAEVRYEAIVYHAVHGRWPPPEQARAMTRGIQTSTVPRITLGPHGTITAEFALPPFGSWDNPAATDVPPAIHGLLSLRPVLLGSKAAPTIVYLCGYADPIVTPTVEPVVNKTTLNRRILPPFCR